MPRGEAARIAHLELTVKLAAMFRRNGFRPDLLDQEAHMLTSPVAPCTLDEWLALRLACIDWVNANMAEMIKREADRALTDPAATTQPPPS